MDVLRKLADYARCSSGQDELSRGMARGKVGRLTIATLQNGSGARIDQPLVDVVEARRHVDDINRQTARYILVSDCAIAIEALIARSQRNPQRGLQTGFSGRSRPRCHECETVSRTVVEACVQQYAEEVTMGGMELDVPKAGFGGELRSDAQAGEKLLQSARPDRDGKRTAPCDRLRPVLRTETRRTLVVFPGSRKLDARRRATRRNGRGQQLPSRISRYLRRHRVDRMAAGKHDVADYGTREARRTAFAIERHHSLIRHAAFDVACIQPDEERPPTLF